MPNRRAISVLVTPFAAIAFASAHSNALRTSLARLLDLLADDLETPVRAGHTRQQTQASKTRFLKDAHYWAPGVS